MAMKSPRVFVLTVPRNNTKCFHESEICAKFKAQVRYQRVVMRGFSLVELLVVVAILGIIAAVGVVGYQGYIDGSKKEVTLGNASTIDRAFSRDVMVIDNKMTEGRTALATDRNNIITREDDCIAYVSAAVDSLISTHKNAYDESVPYAVSLHLEAQWANSSSPTGTNGEARGLPLNVAKLKQGQLGLQCANACSPISNTSDFYIHRCSCLSTDGCDTHTFQQGDGSADTAKYESEVEASKRWDEDGNILIGAHLPEWACPMPLDAGSVCP
jgi:prepilin-type N-terminal cleavage/methylation domain-containing protein